MSELQFKYLPYADLIDHQPIDMEPNVRLSFQVSIAVPYATLIKTGHESRGRKSDIVELSNV